MNPLAVVTAAPAIVSTIVSAVQKLRAAFPKDPEKLLAKLKARQAALAARAVLLAEHKPGSAAHIDKAARAAGLTAMIAQLEGDQAGSRDDG
jgi:cell division protein FtsB